jgi:hypothetical protein
VAASRSPQGVDRSADRGAPVQNPERPISSRPRTPLEGHGLPTQLPHQRRQDQLQPHLVVTGQGFGRQRMVASSAQTLLVSQEPDSTTSE